MNIALIGPRGAGKSKLGRRLSKLAGMALVSTDMAAVYENGGISIPDYIQSCKGNWKPFRDLEKRILKKLANAQNLIIDCGGGILFDLNNIGEEIFSEEKSRLLKNIASVIYLERDFEYLVNKVKNDRTRPSLSVVDSYEKTLSQRLPFYEKTAEYTIRMDKKTPDESAREVCSLLKLI